jgi:hypothetical protein
VSGAEVFAQWTWRLFFAWGWKMKNFWKRWKTKTLAAEPEREWTPQMYLNAAKAERMAADAELAAANFELNHFDARRPRLVNVDGQIAAFYHPELRKPLAARQSQAHAALTRAIQRESEVIDRYAPEPIRCIGGVRVA